MSADVVKGNALDLPISDATVDLIVTSPPYFKLRLYPDDNDVAGQIGQEPTPADFIDALIAATREMVRVLKPGGSIWINLGDKYINRSLSGIPWRFANRVTDELSLCLRAEVVWSKPNGFIDAKARDRFRRTHETWFHFTHRGPHFANIDALRITPENDYRDRPQYRRAEELFAAANLTDAHRAAVRAVGIIDSDGGTVRSGGSWESDSGRLASEVRDALGSYYRELCGSGGSTGVVPGSVREVAAHPFKVPKSLAVEGHFASFPIEWPSVLIAGWSPPDGVVLDPFGGTGTTALAATVAGRHGITVDTSSEYCRVAEWRTTDPAQLASAHAAANPYREKAPHVR